MILYARHCSFGILLGLGLFILACSGAGGNGGSFPANSKRSMHDECASNLISPSGNAVLPEDIFDGAAGTYHLVQADILGEVNFKDGKTRIPVLSLLAGSTQLSAHTQVQHLTANQKILCTQVDQLNPAPLNAGLIVPLTISRNSGTYKSSLEAEFTVSFSEAPRMKYGANENNYFASIFDFKKMADDNGWDAQFYKIDERQVMITWTVSIKNGTQTNRLLYQFLP